MLLKLLKEKFTNTSTLESIAQEFYEEISQATLDTKSLEYLLSLDSFNINYQDKNGNTFLHKCLLNKQLKPIEWLIDNGAEIELCNNKGITPLMLLIEDQNILILDYLLKNKMFNLNQTDHLNRTLLQNATIKGYFSVLQLFIQYRANINHKDQRGRHVLFDALSYGDLKQIKYFLTLKNLKLDIIDNDDHSILDHPQVIKDDNIAMELLKAGIDATKATKDGKTFLYKTVLRGKEALEVLKTAIDAGNNINYVDGNHKTLFTNLIEDILSFNDLEKEKRKNILEMLEYLIVKGLKINILDDDNESALFYAVRAKDLELIKFLLDAGLDVNIKNNQNETVLSIAIFQGLEYIDIISLLLDYKADLKIKNEKDQTLLEVLNELVFHNEKRLKIQDRSFLKKVNPDGEYLKVFKAVVEKYKGSLDFFDSKGDPLFFKSVLIGHHVMFKYYLLTKVDINKKNLYGHNIFYKFVYESFNGDNSDINYQLMFTTLIAFKADQNVKDVTGYTILHKIMHTECKLSLFNILTKSVAFRYDSIDQFGRTVIHSAVWNNHIKVIQKIHQLNEKVINIPDKYGILPITYAALIGNQQLVLTMMQLNSNIISNAKISSDGKKKFTPLLANLYKLKDGLEKEELQSMENLIEHIIFDFIGVGFESFYKAMNKG